jgi:hypothetical protein
MYNKIIAIIFATGILLSLSFKSEDYEQCDVEDALKACKKMLIPYSFQDRKTITFKYESEKQMNEYEVQLFNGERYRIVLNSTYSAGVEFEIYDNPKDNKSRNLLYDSRKDEVEGDLLLYHPETIPYIYIDVIIPSSKNHNQEGCTTIMIGYELTFLD